MQEVPLPSVLCVQPRSCTKLPAKATQSLQFLPAVASWQGWSAPGVPVGRGMTRARGMHAKHSSFFWDPTPTVSPRETCEMCHGSLPDPLLAAGGLPALAGCYCGELGTEGTGTSRTTSLPCTGCPQDRLSRRRPWEGRSLPGQCNPPCRCHCRYTNPHRAVLPMRFAATENVTT